MQMTLTHDAANDVYVLKCIDVRIENAASLQEWATQLRAVLEAAGKKLYP